MVSPDPDPPPELAQHSAAELLPLVYEELRRLASARVRREVQGHAAQPTSLVHEVYLRLIGASAQQEAAWKGRPHFFGAAALAMRRILVERARRRRRQHDRGGDDQGAVTIEALAAEPMRVDPTTMLTLDAALVDLERAHPDLHRIVMLRYFGGHPIEAVAELLEVSVNTVKRRWQTARLWLLDRLERGCEPRVEAP